jgi:hypothetical protein
MKITRAEIDRTLERSNQWARHREAMQILGDALRAPRSGPGRRLGDFLTPEQIDAISMPYRAQFDHEP